VRLPVRFDPGSGETRDFSLCGLYLVADIPLAQGDRIGLRVAVPDPEQSMPVWVSCHGDVVRVEEVGGVLGAGIAIREESLRPLLRTEHTGGR